jgi:hypothetical protein
MVDNNMRKQPRFEANPKKKIKNGDYVHPSPEVKLGVRAVSTVSNFLFNGNLGNQGNSREFLSQLTVSIFDKIRIETFINVSITTNL